MINKIKLIILIILINITLYNNLYSQNINQEFNLKLGYIIPTLDLNFNNDFVFGIDYIIPENEIVIEMQNISFFQDCNL
jgi:hypothetical protein